MFVGDVTKVLSLVTRLVTLLPQLEKHRFLNEILLRFSVFSSLDYSSLQLSREMPSIDEAESQLIRASVICLFFMFAEIAGGILAGSLAILTDAAHLLSDLAGFAVSLVCLWLAKKKSTPLLSFGFKRAEVLGALLSVFLIWIVTFFLVVSSIQRFSLIYNRDPSYEPVNGKLMFFMALLGLLCNIIILNVLGHGHGHGGSEEHHEHSHEHSNKEPRKEKHGHSHGDDEEEEENQPSVSSSNTPDLPLIQEYEIPTGVSIRYSYGSFSQSDAQNGTGRDEQEDEDHHEGSDDQHKSKNINVEAAYIHALGDFLQSIGVIISGAFIWMFPNDKYPMVQLLDPIATFVFSVLVLYSTIKILKTSINVLMEGVPPGLNPKKIKASIDRIPGIVESHDLHVWALSLGETFLSVHVVLKDETKAPQVLRRVHQVLNSKYGIAHSTVQVETDEHYKDGVLKRPEQCHAYDEDVV